MILVEYSRVGGGSAVFTNDQVPDLKLDRFGGMTGTYSGLDWFGQTMSVRGLKPATIVRVKIGQSWLRWVSYLPVLFVDFFGRPGVRVWPVMDSSIAGSTEF